MRVTFELDGADAGALFSALNNDNGLREAAARALLTSHAPKEGEVLRVVRALGQLSAALREAGVETDSRQRAREIRWLARV